MSSVAALHNNAKQTALNLDGFEVGYDSMRLVETRALTLDEKCRISDHQRLLSRRGYGGLLGLTVVVPFTLQVLWPFSGFLLLVLATCLIWMSILGIQKLPNAIRLRQPLTTLWVLNSRETGKTAYYLPEVGIIWREWVAGQVSDRYQRKGWIRVAASPSIRQDSRLTGAELIEIEETLRVQRFFLGPIEVILAVPVGLIVLFIYSPPVGTLLYQLMIASIAYYTVAFQRRKFLRSLRASKTVYAGPNGSEYLPGGILWTLDGQPAKWRYAKPKKRSTAIPKPRKPKNRNRYFFW